jgi:Cu(I)/Ag(I) efflux system outer membrane protein
MSDFAHLRKAGFMPVLAFLFLSACSLAPAYQRPDLPVPPGQSLGGPVQDLSLTGADAEASEAVSLLGWQDYFPEERLKALIGLALENNRDLRLAALRMEEARASFGVSRSERLPMAELMAQEEVTGGARQETMRDYDTSLSLSFQLDFFGRLKNMSQAAFEEYLSSQEAFRAARISLVAEVAEAYLLSRFYWEKLSIAEKTLSSNRASLAFIEERLLSGQSSLLDLEQARSMVAFAEAAKAEAKTEIARADSALSLLLGSFGHLDLLKARPLSAWKPARLPDQVPSKVLLQRPDVLAAEHMLLASHADIGAARAAFFPSLSLTGNTGYMSPELGDLIGGQSQRWSFLPKLTIPIFQGGRNRANLDLSYIRRDKAVAEYEKAIQTAFREVSDSLLAREAINQQYAAQAKYLSVQRRVMELASNRYQNGVISYLEVLEAQRDVFEAEMTLLEIARMRLMNEIKLYAALGGGLFRTSLQESLSGP